MKVALIYPPSCDPTAPYLAVPMLTGFLRANGVDVLPIDANVEAYDALLRRAPMEAMRERLEDRLRRLERRAVLDHTQQLEYHALWQARGDAHAVPDGIDEAVAILRDPVRFMNPELYACAVNTVDAALRVVSAAFAPLQLDFTAYRTPFALTTPEEIVCDAAATHIAGARGKERLTLAGCWAHVYRRFEEAGDDFPAALIVRAWIQDLYRIDKRATSMEERAVLRATESAVVLEKMRTWMHEQRVLATTSFGSAIRYTLKNWDRLTVFVRDPLVWLDNNRTERGLRGPVVGRRNHFGSKSARGTVVAATMYSLVESAKVAGVDHVAYLFEVATRAKRKPGAVLLPAELGVSL